MLQLMFVKQIKLPKLSLLQIRYVAAIGGALLVGATTLLVVHITAHQAAYPRLTPPAKISPSKVPVDSSKPLAETTAGTCQFQKADQPLHVAFCDSFSQPMPTADNRSGDLNATVWGVSRIITGSGGDNYPTGENPSQGFVNTFAPVALDKCGSNKLVYPDHDVAICDGHIVEGANDDGDQTALAMYPKQPFDIAGRTGTVTFDVTADSEGSHAAWPTFVYTDQPVPTPYSSASGIQTSARNSFGFTLDSLCDDGALCGADCPFPSPHGVTVGSMFMTTNYHLEQLNFTPMGCVQESSDVNKMNHVEVRMSATSVEVWASEPGGGAVKEIAVADHIVMPLTRGLLWMEDIHYNANKFNDQQSHSFAWDNFGFDGPVLARDLAFDVPDNGTVINDDRYPNHPGVQLGWTTPDDPSQATTVTVPGVYNVSRAERAIVTFNFAPISKTVPMISVNGHAYIPAVWPFNDDTYEYRTLAVSVPLSQIKEGSNTIAFKDSDSDTVFANVDLILVSAGDTPSCMDPSNCTATPFPR